jgi:hypothetical protein
VPLHRLTEKFKFNCCPERTLTTLRTHTQSNRSHPLVKTERASRLSGAGAPFLPLFQAPFRRTMFRGGRPSPIQPLARSQLQGLVLPCQDPNIIRDVRKSVKPN